MCRRHDNDGHGASQAGLQNALGGATKLTRILGRRKLNDLARDLTGGLTGSGSAAGSDPLGSVASTVSGLTGALTGSGADGGAGGPGDVVGTVTGLVGGLTDGLTGGGPDGSSDSGSGGLGDLTGRLTGGLTGGSVDGATGSGSGGLGGLTSGLGGVFGRKLMGATIASSQGACLHDARIAKADGTDTPACTAIVSFLAHALCRPCLVSRSQGLNYGMLIEPWRAGVAILSLCEAGLAVNILLQLV